MVWNCAGNNVYRIKKNVCLVEIAFKITEAPAAGRLQVTLEWDLRSPNPGLGRSFTGTDLQDSVLMQMECHEHQ